MYVCTRVHKLGTAARGSRLLSLALAGATDRNVKIEVSHVFGKEKALGQDPYAHEAVRKVLALRRPHNLIHTSSVEQQEHTLNCKLCCQNLVASASSGITIDAAPPIPHDTYLTWPHIHGRQCQPDTDAPQTSACKQIRGRLARLFTRQHITPATPAHSRSPAHAALHILLLLPPSLLRRTCR